jgi:hypothetical protein
VGLVENESWVKQVQEIYSNEIHSNFPTISHKSTILQLFRNDLHAIDHGKCNLVLHDRIPPYARHFSDAVYAAEENRDICNNKKRIERI